MRGTPLKRPLYGHISNAKPLNDGKHCISSSTMRFRWHGGWLYVCDYHAGCLGATIAEKEAEQEEKEQE